MCWKNSVNGRTCRRHGPYANVAQRIRDLHDGVKSPLPAYCRTCHTYCRCWIGLYCRISKPHPAQRRQSRIGISAVPPLRTPPRRRRRALLERKSNVPVLTTTPLGPATVNDTFCVVEFPRLSITWIPAVNVPYSSAFRKPLPYPRSTPTPEAALTETNLPRRVAPLPPAPVKVATRRM